MITLEHFCEKTGVNPNTLYVAVNKNHDIVKYINTDTYEIDIDGIEAEKKLNTKLWNTAHELFFILTRVMTEGKLSQMLATVEGVDEATWREKLKTLFRPLDPSYTVISIPERVTKFIELGVPLYVVFIKRKLYDLPKCKKYDYKKELEYARY